MNSMMNQTQKKMIKKLQKSRQMEVMMKNCDMIPADDEVDKSVYIFINL